MFMKAKLNAMCLLWYRMLSPSKRAGGWAGFATMEWCTWPFTQAPKPPSRASWTASPRPMEQNLCWGMGG